MSVEALFKQALGLVEPWVVTECDFDPEAKKLVIKIDFERGARFLDPESGEPCAVHDTRVRKWEHLKFFEHQTLLEARVPRILGKDGKKHAPGRGASKVARLLYFTPGKGKETFGDFAAELDRRGVPREQITEVAMDMSRAFIAGAGAEFPLAEICFDRFHVMKLCGEAIDQVRKDVAREHGGLPKGAMWALRGNASRLSDEQRELRESLCEQHAQIGRSHAIRDFLADAWHYDCREAAAAHLKEVLSWCQRSRLEPMVKLGRTIRRHWEGILGYYQNYTTSSALEAVNGLLQLAKRRARGYRRFENFRAIAYWIAGKLTLRMPASATH